MTLFLLNRRIILFFCCKIICIPLSFAILSLESPVVSRKFSFGAGGFSFVIFWGGIKLLLKFSFKYHFFVYQAGTAVSGGTDGQEESEQHPSSPTESRGGPVSRP